jgi:transposase-like protein
MVKVCPKCHKKSVVKNWIQRWKQAYKCTFCEHRFIWKSRPSSKHNLVNDLRREYIEWKQTYQQMADKLWKNIRTIQRMFDKEIVRDVEFYNKKLLKKPVFIIADCTWFGNTCFLVIKTHEHKKVVYAKALDWDENIQAYVDWISFLRWKWWIIKWIICDGFVWLQNALAWIPFQLCQFHQVKNVIKYLTKKPHHEAWKELLNITYQLKNSEYIEFKNKLDKRYKTHQDRINEKTYGVNEEWKRRRRYTHKRVRSAYNSLKRHLPVLFTYKIYDGMDNTTNALDWYFKLIKAKTNIHNWLENERKKRVVLALLSL